MDTAQRYTYLSAAAQITNSVAALYFNWFQPLPQVLCRGLVFWHFVGIKWKSNWCKMHAVLWCLRTTMTYFVTGGSGMTVMPKSRCGAYSIHQIS